MTHREKSYSGTAVAALIVGAMVAGLVYRYWPSEERAVRRHLVNLAEALSLPYADSEVAMMTRFAAMREYFDPDVRIVIDGREIVSREAVIRLLTLVKPPPGGIHVELSDVQIDVAEDAVTAAVRLTANVSSRDPMSRETTVDARSFTIAMSQARGDWVIVQAEGRSHPM